MIMCNVADTYTQTYIPHCNDNELASRLVFAKMATLSEDGSDCGVDEELSRDLRSLRAVLDSDESSPERGRAEESGFIARMAFN